MSPWSNGWGHSLGVGAAFSSGCFRFFCFVETEVLPDPAFWSISSPSFWPPSLELPVGLGSSAFFFSGDGTALEMQEISFRIERISRRRKLRDFCVFRKNQKVGLGTVENGLAASGFPPEGPKKERLCNFM